MSAIARVARFGDFLGSSAIFWNLRNPFMGRIFEGKSSPQLTLIMDTFLVKKFFFHQT
jgi:hypothetical protein